MKNSTLKMIIVASGLLGTVGFAVGQNRQPTKGRVPDEAFQDGRINVDKVPDYIIAYARNGEVAGYIRKTDAFASDHAPTRIVVFDENLSRAVGHMVVDKGFVPLGAREDEIPAFEARSFTDEDEHEEDSEDLPSEN